MIKNIKINKLSILTLSLGLVMLSCGDSNSENTNKEISEIINNETSTDKSIAKDVESDEFKSLIESGNGLILDVRTPGEVAEGAIDGAINIDFNGDDFESEISKLDKDTPVYVYCHGGGRSGNAMNMMKDLGFSEVYNLVDGYGNWPYKK